MIRFVILVLLTATTALAQDGATLFKSNCSSCHDAGIARVPQTAVLKAMFRTRSARPSNPAR